jgi:hypothetical protein
MNLGPPFIVANVRTPPVCGLVQVELSSLIRPPCWFTTENKDVLVASCALWPVPLG